MITTISHRYVALSHAVRTMALRFPDVRNASTIIFRFALGVVTVALLVYGYFIAATVVDVITRAHYEKLSATLGDQVNQLESQYLEKSSSITRDLAATQGYSESKATLFARMDGTSDRLAFVAHEVR
ncbi:MAG: hypothetical protein ACYC8S_02405 [Minisyncoccota bacterium]